MIYLGLLNLVWLLLWCYIVRCHPENHRWITSQELLYIESHTSLSSPRDPPPVKLRAWFQMLFSSSVLAIIYVKITHAWFFNMLSTKMATFILTILGLNLQQVSVVQVFRTIEPTWRQHHCMISKRLNWTTPNTVTVLSREASLPDLRNGTIVKDNCISSSFPLFRPVSLARCTVRCNCSV